MAEIRLEDLWKHCKTCEGTGRTVERSGSFGMVQSIEQNCAECHGNGGTLTDSGNAILQFLGAMKRQHRL